MNLRIVCILSFLLSVFGSFGQTSPKYEMRGVWLATVYGIDWPSVQGNSPGISKQQKQELTDIVNRLADAGFNAVFFQVRPMADAFYKSDYAPWSSYLTGRRGRPANYDPLDFCITLCHERGMECHAWINPFRVGSKQPASLIDLSYSHLWMKNKVNRTEMTILNPALQETREYLREVCREIAVNYDIDGIVFDDYFYHPEFIPEDETAADWNDYVNSETDLTMGEWRRDNINNTIADIYAELQSIKEGTIRFGVSPQGIAGGNGAHSLSDVPSPLDFGVITGDSQYDKIYSDPVAWMKLGVVDYISPQIYWTTDNPRHPYEGLALWWSAVSENFGRPFFPSLMIANKDDDDLETLWDEHLLQVNINRNAATVHFPGSIFYSASYVAGNNNRGLDEYLRDNVFSSKALVPAMSWKTTAKPLSVTGLSIEGNKVSWNELEGSRYVVYCIPDDYDADTIYSDGCGGISADFIAGVTYSPSFILPEGIDSQYKIAVCAYDRYGNEWQPVFLKW